MLRQLSMYCVCINDEDDDANKWLVIVFYKTNNQLMIFGFFFSLQI